MSPEVFVRHCRRLWGERWREIAPSTLGVHRTTVGRWALGQVPIPGPAAAALQGFLRERDYNLKRSGDPREIWA
jgi:hypothetical protein